MLSLYYKEMDVFEFNGESYVAKASFDRILKIIDLLKEKVSDKYKIILSIKILFGEETDLTKLPLEELKNIFEEVFYYYVKPTENKPKYDLQGNEIEPLEYEEHEQVYSLKYDADYIYASFMQAYGIDLIDQQGKLHWFKFKALFLSLSDDTKFKEVVSIRTWKKPSNNKNAYENQMRELKKAYQLPKED